MLVSEVAKRIDASENTIRNNIKEKKYCYKKNGILHVTDEGFEMLQNKYGLKGEVLSDNDIDFYKGQIKSLQTQLDNQMFQFKVYQEQLEEQKKTMSFYQEQLKIEDHNKVLNSERIDSLEKELHKKELEVQEYQYKLKAEKNKTIWQKIFGSKE